MNDLTGFTRRGNFHTHSAFCDGKNTCEEMLIAALDCGLDALGFSGHAMWPFAGDCHIAINSFGEYVEEINRLKMLYHNKIQLFCGYEAEYLPYASQPNLSVYKSQLAADYVIGSVHYLSPSPNLPPFAVDWKPEILENCAEQCFGGSYRKLVEFYFETLRQMIKYSTFDFAGHLDLIRKLNGKMHFLNEEDLWYREEIIKTARCCGDAGVMTEINTGAISRGVMDDVYPGAEFLAELHRCDVPVVINSDAHSAGGIACAFNRAVTAAKNAGYTGSMQLFWQGNEPVWQFVPFA